MGFPGISHETAISELGNPIGNPTKSLLGIPPRKTQDPNENLTMAQVLHRSTTVSLPNIRKSTSQV
jgi:hypothetical protein